MPSRADSLAATVFGLCAPMTTPSQIEERQLTLHRVQP